MSFSSNKRDALLTNLSNIECLMFDPVLCIWVRNSKSIETRLLKEFRN
jgi:hypothetical protein